VALIGQTLSHYRITAALGAGGMGEVYRATDGNLGRDVAIKVLPPELARDEDRLARFKREAHLLASLNHPHIAAIYGLEEADGKPFLALELVEGEDLKQRLARGPIPVDEALEIAQQIAEALEEAHGKGIVHRDLKPANVKLTPDGRVKVLDFGLAKAWAGDASGASSVPSALSQSPTLARTGTIAGVILGTAAYMSPEQARGKPVDKRADVWSFGVLLWEMLTGRRLFGGDTVTDVIAAVMTREPDLDALPKATPHAVRGLLARCLRKDPRTRLPDIGAARLELQDLRAGTAGEGEAPAGSHEAAARKSRVSRGRELAWAAAAVAMTGVAALLFWQRFTTPRDSRPPAHFVLDLPPDLRFSDPGAPALSPDGRQLAFAGISDDGRTQLWLRSLDSPEFRALAGTEGAAVPFWSPDSTALAFVTGPELRKVALAGGAVQRVCATRPGLSGGTWNQHGTIVFSAAAGAGTAILYQVSAAGGEPAPLTTLDTARGETAHILPQFLPDGRQLLVTIQSTEPANTGLFALALDASGERRRILPDIDRTLYASGRLLRIRDEVLTSRPFDARRLVASGDAVPIASRVATWAIGRGFSWFSASANGRLAWFPARSRELRLAWLDRRGGPLGTLGEPALYGQLALSPDGRRVAVEVQDAAGPYDIWLFDVARGLSSRLTSDATSEREPVWSPDGSRLAYSTIAPDGENILIKDLSGSQAAAPLPGGVGATAGVRDIPENWSRAGNTLIYMTLGGVQSFRTLWALPMDGQKKPEQLMAGHGFDEPHVSPDGRWLAYVSTESGRFEVYVAPFRRTGERLRVSDNGGGQPRWRGDGKELLYLTTGGAIASVSVRDSGSALALGAPTTLVPADKTRAVFVNADYDDWDVTPDGQRFLVKQPAVADDTPRIHVLLDWPSVDGR
jgi:Tol biopolymer transport system component